MCKALLNLKSYFIVYQFKGGYMMKTCRELYAELEYWGQYQPNNASSSILKQAMRNQIKSQILEQIDVSKNKDIILKIVN